MKQSLTISLLLSSAGAKRLSLLQQESIPECQSANANAQQHVVKLAQGSTVCKVTLPGEETVIFMGQNGLAQAAPAFNPRAVEHCPDFDERMTLTDGRTNAVPYPLKGWNCNPSNFLAEAAPFDPRQVEHCPDFNERMTLSDGQTAGIPYPKKGWNCNPEWSLVETQTAPWNTRQDEH